jgi:site-specific recombinase XerD
MLDEDVDLGSIQAILGHQRLSTTEWYLQVSMKNKSRASQKLVKAFNVIPRHPRKKKKAPEISETLEISPQSPPSSS